MNPIPIVDADRTDGGCCLTHLSVRTPEKSAYFCESLEIPA